MNLYRRTPLVDYTVASLGEDEVYAVDARNTLYKKKSTYSLAVYRGEANFTCSGTLHDRRSTIIFVEHSSNDAYAVLNASSLFGGSNEVWIVDDLVSVGTGANYIPTSLAVAIECQEGCFEAVVEWSLSDSGLSIDDSSKFLSIWYEGLNFYISYDEVDNYPGCEDRDTDREDLSFFKKGDCSGAISSSYVQDGGQENVTAISAWAIVVVCISCVLTAWYKVAHQKGGYDLVTYEGIAQVYYKEGREPEMRVGDRRASRGVSQKQRGASDTD